MSNIPFLVSFLVVLVIGTGCHDRKSQSANRVERNGLAVEFTPTCDEYGISLASSVENISPQERRIESGSLPWQYDLLGTKFVAEAAAGYLQRNEAAPMFGRTGPIDLAPQERRSGSTPIGIMFPEMKNHLAKGQIVTVRWKYTVSSNLSEVIEGVIIIKQDPCRTETDG